MSYATDDAEMSSAREILFLCGGRLSNEILREKARRQPDAQRLDDLELVISQLRDEVDAVTAGNRAVSAGTLALRHVAQSRSHTALTGCLIAASLLPHPCITMRYLCTIVVSLLHHPCNASWPAGQRDRV